MNGDAEGEAPRPRPLSSGIWTLFSWLRRTERSSSSESISSVGSDRTAASFDFLAPFHYKHVNEPLVLPQSPITETYKKRLLERNIRRQNDQDLTLRRKYGLYTEEGVGYDAFSLPPARKIPKDSVRLRRATSEVSQRRAAYVPGKRRAPLPPTANISNSLPRNYKRKRPAPKPPTKLIEENKENIEINKILQMDSKSAQEKRLSENGFSLEYKIEKPIKQDHFTKDVKLRSDKSFLKQIFDSKKRYSAIDTTQVKLLPSISELDKQAAEIIESKRSLDARRGHNNDNILKLSGTEGNWICTICLRKYKMAITSCSYCVVTKEPKEAVFTNTSIIKNINSANASNTCTQTENVSKSNRRNDVDEKKKLRDMLKEMKDSLPKRPKHDKRDNSNILPATETPTLPIGSTMKLDQNLSDNILFTETSANKSNDTKVNIQLAKNSFLLSQPCSSKQIVSDIVLSNIGKSKVQKNVESTGNSSNLDIPLAKPVNKICELPKKSELLENNFVTEIKNRHITVNNISTELQNENKLLNLGKNESVTKIKESITALPKGSNTSGSKPLLYIVNKDDETAISAIKKISKPSNHRKDNSSENIKTTQDKFKRQSVLVPIKEVEVINEKLDEMPQNQIETIRLGDVISSKEIQGSNETSATDTKKNSNLHSPLKISSLLNPIYYPKKEILEDTNKNNLTDANKVQPKESPKLNTVSNISKQVFADTKHKTSRSVSVINEPESTQKNCSITETKESIHVHESTRVNRPDVTTEKCENNLDIHACRRELVNQLEQAISKGDEQTAAEAAANLAKLKLSCSVLSFSSQIVAEPKILPKRFEIPKNNKGNTQSNEINISKKLSKIDNLSQTQKNESNEIKLKEKPLLASNQHAPIPSTSKCIEPNPDQIIPISVWIEDKEAARGPIRLNVPRKSVVGDLKKEAELSLGLEIRLQRWIIGRTLCSNDNTPLTSLAGADLVAPFYLCVVESETKTNNANEQTKTAKKSTASPTKDEEKDSKSGDFYIELMKLEQQALVPNTEVFECGVCIEECAVGAGAVLRECIHTFCRECLCDVIRHCEEPVVSCPAIGCPGALQEREIRALLTSEEYEKWLARGLAVAESGTRNTFHCRTRDCTGWAFCEPGVRRFPCPVCKHTNCLPCQAVHEGETCARYQEKLRQAVTAVEANQTDEGTQALLKSLIDRGEALECPECKAIITKKWGCDWIKCSACKTEICWVTKGRRWGPGGKGDTSGGCRCGIDGKRCHPSCGYCH